MSKYSRNRKFFDEPYVLTKKQQSEPAKVITWFFGDMQLSDFREKLDYLRELVSTSDDEFGLDSEERWNFLDMLTRLEMVMEAAYLLRIPKHPPIVYMGYED